MGRKDPCPCGSGKTVAVKSSSKVLDILKGCRSSLLIADRLLGAHI
ncbi:MAG: hypothetical protein GX766_10315 [Firmicutes bacterium]|nr:hypothetical protein [Bacillota bacterium]